MLSEIQKRLDFSKEIAKRAGEILLSYFEKNFEVVKKGKIDLVTDADFKSENFLKSEISQNFPDDGILGEEKGQKKGKNNIQWVVDPLDGTVNFSHSYPFFSVSIAIEREGEVLSGVVFDPIRDELFYGIKSGGAFLNGKKIEVSKVEKLVDSMLATGFPYDIHEARDNTIDLFVRFVKRAQAIRRDGSAALDICYVAMGRFDGFWERRLKPWDTAAATLILKEAGGVVSDFLGKEYSIYSPEILCSNGKIHGEMIEVLNSKSFS